VRRLSSITATRESISLGPTVVAPPKHLMAPSAASEVASAMEVARHELESSATSVTPITPDECAVSSDFAYAFDIDVSINSFYSLLECY
jgi:hypothetical protein